MGYYPQKRNWCGSVAESGDDKIMWFHGVEQILEAIETYAPLGTAAGENRLVCLEWLGYEILPQTPEMQAEVEASKARRTKRLKELEKRAKYKKERYHQQQAAAGKKVRRYIKRKGR